LIDTIVDLSHEDDVKDWGIVANGGTVAAIHKASQGISFTDPLYSIRRMYSGREGLLWGAYHFATLADGGFQADRFLAAAQPDSQTFLALDIEHNPDGGTVTLSQARSFVLRIHAATGRFPFIYGSDLLADFCENEGDPILAQCPLWIARHSVHPPVVPLGWKNWTLWQYLAGEDAVPADALPGLGFVDRSRFAGDLTALKAVWSK
jgi:lysozyme